MSGAQVLEFGSASDFGNLGFPDLEKKLQQRLEAIKTLPDLEKLIEILKPLLKANRFNEEEQSALRRLRQRAYDRKRHARFGNSKTKSISELEVTIAKSPDPAPNKSFRSASLNKEIDVTTVAALPNQKTETKPDNFSQGVQRAFVSINGEAFVKTAPIIVLWFAAAATVSYFLWQQSLALYQSAGFDNALFSAAGGILMIVGFAAYHSISRSWLALFFCIYALAYEGYLMVSGTIHDDKQIAITAVESDQELIFLQEKAEKERTRYQELKQRYEDPESKVFKNDWFLKNHLNPAWDLSATAHEEFVTKKAALMAVSNDIHVTWLKIFYRLGLVFLCMMLVHRFFASFVGK